MSVILRISFGGWIAQVRTANEHEWTRMDRERNKVFVASEAILASAGFGKTYHLAHRYIKLLALGCTPSHICAVTFSRKAAGEIFDKIVKYLREAANDPKAAQNTAAAIGMPELDQNSFMKLLKNFLHELHRNHIGTLDSFTVSVIRAFPMELGISPNLRLMDNNDSAAQTVRRQILARVFNGANVADREREDFHEAYKQATFGSEEKRPHEKLDKFISDNWERYQLLPDPSAWGAADRIWPDGCQWLGLTDAADIAGAELAELIGNREFADIRIRPGLLKCIDALAGYTMSSAWPRDVENKIVEALLDIPDFLSAGTVTIEYYKKNIDFDERETKLWQILLQNLIGTEIRRSLQMTSGIARILSYYERLYGPVLRSGQMTFNDAQYLLTEANHVAGGSLVSRQSGMDNRLYIDYRLDCALDHWLIDEFQDTSDLQWEVIKNLIDELMQEPDRNRSFFYVGDVKQAIYAWRGGNADLFSRIRDHYGIHQHILDKSYRSCRAVLDMVNCVFDNLPESVSENVRELWKPIWVHHNPAQGAVPETGHTALLVADPTGEKGKCLSTDRFHAVAALINEINPVRRGLSLAVLVRRNDTGKELVDQLRKECLPTIQICHEGRARIADNPVVGVILSLIRFAAHPGDMLAWRHVQMSPLGVYMNKHGHNRENLPCLLLGEIQKEGFEAFVRKWGSRLEILADDQFGRKRITDLASASGLFDQTASRDCREYLEYVADYEVEETGSEISVKVMTIHKSKGLTFDIVILPELERGDSGSVDFVMPRDSKTDEPLWALTPPRKFVSERDSVLLEIRKRSLESKELENLCALYVGMTRARYALYVVADPDNRPSSDAAFLKNQLAGSAEFKPVAAGGEAFSCLYESGERGWYLNLKHKSVGNAELVPEFPADFKKQKSQRRRLTRVEPSSEAVHNRNTASLFKEETHEIRDFGSAIHELFQAIEWIDDIDIETVIQEWQKTSRYGARIENDVIQQFRNCVQAASIRNYLIRPMEAGVVLWREKAFEYVSGDELVSGIFDRVMIHYGKDGRPASATVLDYKSSMVRTDEDVVKKVDDYTKQMMAYRQALMRITGLPAGKIKLILIFTRAQLIREIG